MKAKNIITLLGTIALFHGLPVHQIQRLYKMAVIKNYPGKQGVFFDGEEAEGFYIVASGRVKIFKLSPEGREQILHIINPGEPFGEVPMFEGGRFPAHAETMEDSTLLFFPRKTFVEFVGNDPSFAMNMLALLSRRLRQFTVLAENLSLRDVPSRLSAFFLYTLKNSPAQGEFVLDITKGQLANLIGTIPETLSRILGKMAQQGTITINGKKITINNKKELENMASGNRLIPL